MLTFYLKIEQGFLAIVQTMLDESTVSPAVASLIQGASDDTKNSVVQFVRAAKVVSVLCW